MVAEARRAVEDLDSGSIARFGSTSPAPSLYIVLIKVEMTNYKISRNLQH